MRFTVLIRVEFPCYFFHLYIVHVITHLFTDPCQPNPCQNNGLCSAALDGTHSCVCRTGFFGDNCQIGIYTFVRMKIVYKNQMT